MDEFRRGVLGLVIPGCLCVVMFLRCLFGDARFVGFGLGRRWRGACLVRSHPAPFGYLDRSPELVDRRRLYADLLSNQTQVSCGFVPYNYQVTILAFGS